MLSDSSLGSALARDCSARGSSARASWLFSRLAPLLGPSGFALALVWLGTQLPAQLDSALPQRSAWPRLSSAWLRSEHVGCWHCLAQISSDQHRLGTALLSASPLPSLPLRCLTNLVSTSRVNKFGFGGGTKTEYIHLCRHYARQKGILKHSGQLSGAPDSIPEGPENGCPDKLRGTRREHSSGVGDHL